MKKDDLTNLLLEVEKFMKYFPDRKDKIEDELLSSMILEITLFILICWRKINES